MIDERVINNIKSMRSQGAPDEDIEQYLQEEGIDSPPGALGSFASGLPQGATFGFSDEIAGLVGDKYKENTRDYQKLAETIHPYANMAGELTGAVASPITMGVGKAYTAAKSSIEAGKMSKLAEMIGKTGLGVGSSVGTGAAYEAGKAEENKTAAATNPATTTFNAGLAMAMPVVGRTIGGVVNSGVNKFLPRADKLTSAEKEILEGLKNINVQSAQSRMAAAESEGLTPGLAQVARNPYDENLPNEFIGQKLEELSSKATSDEASRLNAASSRLGQQIEDRKKNVLSDISDLSPEESIESLIEASKSKIDEVQKPIKEASESFDQIKSKNYGAKAAKEWNSLVKSDPFVRDAFSKAYKQIKDAVGENEAKRILTEEPARVFNATRQNLVNLPEERFAMGKNPLTDAGKVKLTDATSLEYNKITSAKQKVDDLMTKYDSEFAEAKDKFKKGKAVEGQYSQRGSAEKIITDISKSDINDQARAGVLDRVFSLDPRGINKIKSELGENGNQLLRDAAISRIKQKASEPSQIQKFWNNPKESAKLRAAIGNKEYLGVERFYTVVDDLGKGQSQVFKISKGDQGNTALKDAALSALFLGTGWKAAAANKGLSAALKLGSRKPQDEFIDLLFDSDKGKKLLDDLASGKLSRVKARESVIDFASFVATQQQINENIGE